MYLLVKGWKQSESGRVRFWTHVEERKPSAGISYTLSLTEAREMGKDIATMPLQYAYGTENAYGIRRSKEAETEYRCAKKLQKLQRQWDAHQVKDVLAVLGCNPYSHMSREMVERLKGVDFKAMVR